MKLKVTILVRQEECGGFLSGSNLPALQEIWVQSLGQEDPLEKGMATHSSVLAWRIPWTERSLASYSPWGHKELDRTEQLNNNNNRKYVGPWAEQFEFVK